MHPTPSALPEVSRTTVVQALNHVLLDGLDFYGQVKVAHWNVKGPHFLTVHPFLDTLASELACGLDEIAERAVTLGGRAQGTAKQVALGSRLEALPEGVTGDLRLLGLVAQRLDHLLVGLRGARTIASTVDDEDTADLLTSVIRGLEKQAWFVKATLDA